MKSRFLIRDPAFYRNLFALAVPICLQNSISHAVTLADNVMVGKLGETAIGALYIGSVVQLILATLFFGVAGATFILTAQYWGERNLDAIKDILSIGMRVTVLLGLLFTLCATFFPKEVVSLFSSRPEILADAELYVGRAGLSYLFFSISQMVLISLRSVEVVKIGLVNSVIAFLVNVSLNYLLIFGKGGFPAMGIAGAAYGTVIARFVELAVVLVYALRMEGRLKLRLSDFRRWNPQLAGDLFRYGMPVVLGQLVWACNLFGRAAVIGRMNGEGIAAAGIIDALDGLVWMGPLGLAIAAGIVTGKTIGAGEIGKIRPLSRTLQLLFVGIGLLTALFLLILRDPFLSIYKIDSGSLEVARSFFLVFAVSTLGRSYQAAGLMGLVKAGGDTAFVLKNDAFWVFCWVLPSALIAQHCLHLSDLWVYILLLSDQITKCFVAFVKINSYNWMKKLTRPRAG